MNDKYYSLSLLSQLQPEHEIAFGEGGQDCYVDVYLDGELSGYCYAGDADLFEEWYSR